MALIKCAECSTEISDQAASCPKCGKRNASSNAIVSGAALILLAESGKKSGIIAALLNSFIPGVGYMYCGRWILGIFALFVTIIFAIIMFAVDAIFGIAVILFILLIEGLLCAERHNKKLLKKLLDEHR